MIEIIKDCVLILRKKKLLTNYLDLDLVTSYKLLFERDSDHFDLQIIHTVLESSLG